MDEIATDILRRAHLLRDFTADTLSSLIRIPSPCGEEEKVCRKIEELCRDVGFDRVRVDGLGSVIATMGTGARSVSKATTARSTSMGAGARSLAFDAHVDTVGVGDPDQWELDPFSGLVREGKVHGRGAADQKGGAAAMVAAARILRDIGYDGPTALHFTFTVLEEDLDGLCWRWLIEHEGLTPECVVSTEPTSLRLYRGQRGRMEMEVEIRGISAHGSAPERGESAAYKAARATLAIERLNGQLPGDDFLGKGSITVSRIEVKGPSLCAVPDVGSLHLDRRLTRGETAEAALAEVRRTVGKDAAAVIVPRLDRKGWNGAQSGQELFFPSWVVPEDHPLVRSASEAYRSLFAREPEIGKWTFSTNCVAICGNHGIPCIGFGPGDEEQAHAPNEWTRVDDLERSAAFYAMLPLALGRMRKA